MDRCTINGDKWFSYYVLDIARAPWEMLLFILQILTKYLRKLCNIKAIVVFYELWFEK